MNESEAFPAVLCTMWQGQPLTYIKGFFCKTQVMMEFLFPRFTAVLSNPILTQLPQLMSDDVRIVSILAKSASAVPKLKFILKID